MDLKQMIAAREAARAGLVAKREGLLKEAEAIRATVTAEHRSDLTEAEQSRHGEILAERATLREQIAQVDAELVTLRAEVAEEERVTRAAQESHPGAQRAGAAATTQEREAVYSKRKDLQDGVSFFRDMLRAQTGAADPAVTERISKHMNEARESGRFTERAIGTGNVGGLVPPLYLTEEVAEIARAGRATANIIRRLPLPAEGMNIVIPRQTTGVTAAVQATQNSAVSNTDAALTDLTVPVITIAGQQDPSRQLLERGVGIDTLLYGDLIGAYNVALDAQVLTGSGAAGQALGILNTAGVNQATAFTAPAAFGTLNSKIAGLTGAIQGSRFLPATGIIMHPRRWAWLKSLLDSSGRPLVNAYSANPQNSGGVYEGPKDSSTGLPVGDIQGIPVYEDANIPTAVGTGPEDQVIVARLIDALLWEDGDGTPQQLRFEETTGGSLTVKLVAYGYAAFTAGRYPQSVGIVGGNSALGNGLIAPTF